MGTRFGLLIALTLVAACSPPAQTSTTATTEAAAPMVLACEAWAHVSGATLEQRFGSDNVVEQTLPGPEGETYVATVIYPNTPDKRVEIVWRDLEGREVPMSVTVRGERSDWAGPRGIRLGAPLESIEQANGRPFQLYGFGWDYGGYVNDWKGGAVNDPACHVGIRFDPSEDGDDSAVTGDGGFMSDAPGTRAAQAHVSEISLGFSAPQ